MSTFQIIIIAIIPVIFAITVHEVAHGWVASKLGDQTAKMLGRLTLNPIKHIDPIGTILVPGILLFLGGFIFGWAKPVPVEPRNLRRPKQDMIYVAIAGPLSNLLMAFIWAAVLKLGLVFGGTETSVGAILVMMGKIGIAINIVLMTLNLIPIPPLDGGRVLVGLLPPGPAYQVSKIEPFGIFIILGLIFLGLFHVILLPVLTWFNALVSVLFQY